MGRGGKNIKPVSELKANGTYRPAYHANRLEIPTTDKAPPAPADFDEAHRAAWVEFCELLKSHNLLTTADVYSIRTFIEAFVTSKTTYAILLAEGFMQDGRKHPLHMVYAESVKTMRALYADFGLTPRARMGMKVTDKAPKEKSYFEKLMEEMADA